MCYSMCCSICCSGLQCVAECCLHVHTCAEQGGHHWLKACCSVLQRVAVRCSVLQCVAVCCSVLSAGAVQHGGAGGGEGSWEGGQYNFSFKSFFELHST